MGLKNLGFFLALLLVTVAFAAQPAQAQFRRGYLSPSGNGAPCPNGTSSCVSDNGSTLEIGNGTTTTDYQIVGVGGIVSGTTVDFTFNGPAPGFFSSPMSTFANKSDSAFSVLTCDSQTLTTSGGSTTTVFGIFDSSGNFENGNCTMLADPTILNSSSSPVIEAGGCATNMVCLNFGSGAPGTWFFAEDISSTNICTNAAGAPTTCPEVTAISATLGSSGGSGDGGGGGGTTPTPEPASMTLLAAGLVGLGALRRKRA